MRKSRLSAAKQARLIEHFVAVTTARTAAVRLGVNENGAAYYFHRLREWVYQALEQDAPLGGKIEVDESYFGGKRTGKRGRGAAGKVPVPGIRASQARWTCLHADYSRCYGEYIDADYAGQNSA